jgi:hypothetical protein
MPPFLMASEYSSQKLIFCNIVYEYFIDDSFNSFKPYRAQFLKQFEALKVIGKPYQTPSLNLLLHLSIAFSLGVNRLVLTKNT